MKSCSEVIVFIVLMCLILPPVVTMAEESQDKGGEQQRITEAPRTVMNEDKPASVPQKSADDELLRDESHRTEGEGFLSEETVRLSQVIAAFGSLGAMLFLLWQNLTLQRQTRELEHSIRSSTYQSIVTHYMDINKTLMSNDKLGAAFEHFDVSEPASNEQEETRKKWLAFWLINHYENAYMQRRINALPDELWKGIEADCLMQLGRPYVANLWNVSRGLFSEEFREFIDEKLGNQSVSKRNVALEAHEEKMEEDVGKQSEQNRNQNGGN